MGNDILKKLKKFFEFVNGFFALRRIRSERHSANTQNMGQEAQKMKKILAGALTAAVVLTAGGAVWAAGGRSAGWRYVDENGDGVCDNQGADRGRMGRWPQGGRSL